MPNIIPMYFRIISQRLVGTGGHWCVGQAEAELVCGAGEGGGKVGSEGNKGPLPVCLPLTKFLSTSKHAVQRHTGIFSDALNGEYLNMKSRDMRRHRAENSWRACPDLPNKDGACSETLLLAIVCKQKGGGTRRVFVVTVATLSVH